MRTAFCLLAAIVLLLPPGTTSAEDLPLLGLAHVGIRVSDLDKARSFYRGVLGFEEAFDTRTPDGQSIVAAYFKVNDRQFIELLPGLKDDDLVPMTHIAIYTDDIAKLRRMLGERGVLAGPIGASPGDGNLSCSVGKLPGQNLGFLEFVQSVPDSRPSRAVGRALAKRRISMHLEHAGIVATDFEAAKSFYVETLGFRETWGRNGEDGKPALVHLRMPGMSGDYVELSNKPNPLKRAQAGMAAHLSLEVPDIKVAYRETLARGETEDRKEPRFGKDERWQFNLFDPDGTRVECMQPRAKPAP